LDSRLFRSPELQNLADYIPNFFKVNKKFLSRYILTIPTPENMIRSHQAETFAAPDAPDSEERVFKNKKGSDRSRSLFKIGFKAICLPRSADFYSFCAAVARFGRR